MDELMLTIGILFCDKDYKYVSNLISTIRTNLKGITYEIILLDNREDTITNTFIPSEYTILNNSVGENLHQLISRKMIIQEAKGKYVWFIDADDTIPVVDFTDKKVRFDRDILVFSESQWVTYEEKVHFSPNSPYIIKDPRIPALWMCFISKKVLDKVVNGVDYKVLDEEGNVVLDKSNKVVTEHITYIEDSDRISIKEDAYIIACSLANSRTIDYNDIVIYTYNREKSTAMVLDFTNRIDDFIFYASGFNEIVNRCKRIFNDDLGIFDEFMKRLVKTSAKVEVKKENGTIVEENHKLSLFTSIKMEKTFFKDIVKAFNKYVENNLFEDNDQYFLTKKTIETYFGEEIPTHIIRVGFYKNSIRALTESKLVQPQATEGYIETLNFVKSEEQVEKELEIKDLIDKLTNLILNEKLDSKLNNLKIKKLEALNNEDLRVVNEEIDECTNKINAYVPKLQEINEKIIELENDETRTSTIDAYLKINAKKIEVVIEKLNKIATDVKNLEVNLHR